MTDVKTDVVSSNYTRYIERYDTDKDFAELVDMSKEIWFNLLENSMMEEIQELPNK